MDTSVIQVYPLCVILNGLFSKYLNIWFFFFCVFSNCLKSEKSKAKEDQKLVALII